MDAMAGGELTQELNRLTERKALLREEYQKAIKEASDSKVRASQLKIQISQCADDIAACKYNVKMEQN